MKNFSIILKKYFNRWIYVFLICLWPIINYLGNNFNTSNIYKSLMVILIGLFLVTVLFLEIVDFFFKKGMDHYLFFLFSGCVLFFTFGKLSLFFMNSYVRPAYVWGALCLILLAFSWRFSGNALVKKIIKPIIITLAFLSLASYVFLSWNYRSQNKGPIDDAQYAGIRLKYKPDIYYILMDAYGRQDTLKEMMGYDNEPFLKELEKRGFVVNRAIYSNYHFTIPSLSATMNMDYHKADLSSYVPQAPMLSALDGNNHVRKILKNNGYKVVNIPSHWQHIRSVQYQDASIEGNSLEVFKSFFSQTPLKIIPWQYHYVNNKDIIKGIELFPNEPKFVFVHLAQVHDALCVYLPFSLSPPPDLSPDEGKKCYVTSVKVMNENMLEVIDRIRQKNPQSLIILQSDHGPAYIGGETNQYLDEQAQRRKDFPQVFEKIMHYKFGAFSAIYLPDYNSPPKKYIKEYLSGPSTLVNTFRCIFNYLSGKNVLALKEDRSSFLYDKDNRQGYGEVPVNNLIKKDAFKKENM